MALGTCTANGYASTAIGLNTNANSAYSISLGAQNFDAGSKTEWIPTDPILTVGIGNPSIIESKNALAILKNGLVLIGTTTNKLNPGADPTTKLAVNGNIYATEVRVRRTTMGSFPDFVFKKDYKLKSLPEVENFINKNKHLEGIPTAQEVDKTGIDLGAMNYTIVQKVEELTLYLIDMNKNTKN